MVTCPRPRAVAEAPGGGAESLRRYHPLPTLVAGPPSAAECPILSLADAAFPTVSLAVFVSQSQPTS